MTDVSPPVTDAARRWSGWGTALKPAHEPIVVARKPVVGTVAGNVQAHGTGALNIDATRVGDGGGGTRCTNRDGAGRCRGHQNAGRSTSGETVHGPNTAAGRWPPNVVLDEAAAAELDRQSGSLTSGRLDRSGITAENGIYGARPKGLTGIYEQDSGGASRFFPTFRYEGKAPAHERPRVNGVSHATVKPLALMRWLVRLVTPPGGLILDPFAGSGTTAEAAALEGFDCIAIELEPTYLPLIAERLSKPLQSVLPLAVQP
jgi:site-specific DNA-methyltransferase (adenine-specific)